MICFFLFVFFFIFGVFFFQKMWGNLLDFFNLFHCDLQGRKNNFTNSKTLVGGCRD